MKTEIGTKNTQSASVTTTGIGGAISIIFVVIANKFGADLGAELSAMIVGSLTTVLNYFLPVIKKNN